MEKGALRTPDTSFSFSLVVTSQMNLSGSLLFFPVVSEEGYVLTYSFSKHDVFQELQICILTEAQGMYMGKERNKKGKAFTKVGGGHI